MMRSKKEMNARVIDYSSVPAKAIWRTIGPALCQFGSKVFEKI